MKEIKDISREELEEIRTWYMKFVSERVNFNKTIVLTLFMDETGLILETSNVPLSVKSKVFDYLGNRLKEIAKESEESPSGTL